MMKNLKVIRVEKEGIIFENGYSLESYHDRECCEHHWLSFENLSLSDFEGLEFDLSNDDFFERIEGFGIALKPISGFPIRVPGYGSNNGCYSSNLDLILTDSKFNELKRYDIKECQGENLYL